MNDRLVEEVTAELMRRLEPGRPTALLIGEPPARDTGYAYVSAPPYDAVVIGSLTAGALLQLGGEPVLEALLEGKPVILNEAGLLHRRHRSTANRLLWSRLLDAERQLRQMGVQVLAEDRQVITAQMARTLRRTGQRPPSGAVVTPLAKDILEGIEP